MISAPIALALAKPDPVWAWTRRLRMAGRAMSVLWAVAVVGFLVCVALRATTELQSALGVVASGLFALGYVLQSLANRAELRAVAIAAAERRQLVSSTSRRR